MCRPRHALEMEFNLSNYSLWRPRSAAWPNYALSCLILAGTALLAGCASAPATTPLKKPLAPRMTLSFALAPASSPFCVWDLSVTLGIGDPLAVSPTQAVPGKSCAPVAMPSMHWQALPSYDIPYRHYRTAIVQYRRQAGGPLSRHEFNLQEGAAPRKERFDMGLQISVLPAGVQVIRWDAQPSEVGISSGARTFEYTPIAEKTDSPLPSKTISTEPANGGTRRVQPKAKRVVGR